MKKRIISMVLALCLVLSLVPAGAFASDKSGVTVEYDIKSILQGNNSTGKKITWGTNPLPKADLSYTATNGFFNYEENSSGTDVVDNSLINWNDKGLYLKKSAWWAFKIYVPADGMYTPKVKYAHAAYKANTNNTLHVSLVKADSVSEINTTVINENKLKNDGTVTGITHPGDSVTAEKWYDDPYAFDAQTLTRGEYYVIYSCNNVNNFAQVNNFILDGGPGKAYMGKYEHPGDTLTVVEKKTRDISVPVLLSDNSWGKAVISNCRVEDESVATVRMTERYAE